jgi:sigma-E factor negative regulatory protein RseB
MHAMSLLRRPGLLLSAAMTVTVPGVLAVLAVLGHEHAVSEARSEALAMGANLPQAQLPADSLPPEMPAALVSGPAPVRDAAAQMAKVSGMSAHTAVFGVAESADQVAGMRLLRKAAVAGLVTSYQGVEVIAQSGVNGTVTMISNVWHRGGLTVTQTSDTALLTGSQPYVAYNGGDHSPEGVFGVTKTLVALLGSHYIAVFTGTGSAIDRQALIVELHRVDGSLAARFWLDSKTLVPLQRDVFDTSAQLVGVDQFVQVQFGALAAPPGTSAPVQSAWSRVEAPARLLLSLNGSGWRLPAVLPGGLTLYQAARSQTDAGEVVDLGYSDGLSVVSLFVQRGTLAPKMTGWQPVNVNGHLVYVAEHSITWAGRGFVYTMIADAPPRTVEAVITALPQNSSPGFLTRLGRGLDRLATLVNPFH